MYQVLLVDDERMILDGISSIVDWHAQGTVLSGTARNGLEALEFIENCHPDIVISDITMPGLDGMELIEECYTNYPETKWIFLSGYNEFEYAQKAMRYGVKHYLLKPCNEELISEALRDIVEELEDQEEKSMYLKTVENKAIASLQEEREWLFKEIITNPTTPEEKKDYFYRNYLGFPDNRVSVYIICCHLEDSYELSNLLFIKKKIEKQMGSKAILAWTITGRNLILLVKGESNTENLFFTIDKVLKQFMEDNPYILTTVVSKKSPVKDIYQLHQNTVQFLEEKFYAGKGRLIFSEKIGEYKSNDHELYENDQQRLILLLKAGRQEEAEKQLDDIIDKIRTIKLKPTFAKSFLIQLYRSMLKVKSSAGREKQLEEINELEKMETLSLFHQTLKIVLISENLPENKTSQVKYSSIVINMLKVIQENLDNPELSLQWVANKELYMNTDYLGKLFRKEVGEKFSTFVTNKRINMALEIIESESDVKVFELAERIGLGNNPQYFSQIFKKRTGCSPSDIIKTN